MLVQILCWSELGFFKAPFYGPHTEAPFVLDLLFWYIAQPPSRSICRCFVGQDNEIGVGLQTGARMRTGTVSDSSLEASFCLNDVLEHQSTRFHGFRALSPLQAMRHELVCKTGLIHRRPIIASQKKPNNNNNKQTKQKNRQNNNNNNFKKMLVFIKKFPRHP